MAMLTRVATPVVLVAGLALTLLLLAGEGGGGMKGEDCQGGECGGILPLVSTQFSEVPRLKKVSKVSKVSLSESTKTIAFCIPGDAKYLDVTARSLIRKIHSLHAKVSIFVSTIFNENTYKLNHLRELNITALNVHGIGNLELVRFFERVYSMETQEATDLAFDLKLGRDCLSMIRSEENISGEKFSAIAFSRTGHFWSKKASTFKRHLMSVFREVETSPKPSSKISFTAGIGDSSSMENFFSADFFFHNLNQKWKENSKDFHKTEKWHNQSAKADYKWISLVEEFKKENGEKVEDVFESRFLTKNINFSTENGPFCFIDLSSSGLSEDENVSEDKNISGNEKEKDVYGRRCTAIDLKSKKKRKMLGRSLKFKNFETCLEEVGNMIRSIVKYEGPDAKIICARAEMGSMEHLGTDYGGWRLFQQRLSSNSSVFSVGIGQDISFDLQLIQTFQCQVHAFDCTPISMNWLKTQVTPKKWYHHPYLLGIDDGDLTLAMPAGFGTSFASLRANAIGFRKDVDKVTLPARSLESLMRLCGVEKIDVLKVDIEGGEFPVIEGWAKGEKSAPKACQILMEFHGRLFHDGTAVRQKAFDNLLSIGFIAVACSSDTYGSDDCLFFSPKECLGIV